MEPSEACAWANSTVEQLHCLEGMVRQLQHALEPQLPLPFDQWPGNSTCISCRLFLGLFIVAIELVCLYHCVRPIFRCLGIATWVPAPRRRTRPSAGPPSYQEALLLGHPPAEAGEAVHMLLPEEPAAPAAPRRSRAPTLQPPMLADCCSAFGTVFAVLGFVYWFLVFALYWNFISWVMLAGPLLVLPAMWLWARVERAVPPAVHRHRLKLACWVLGILTLTLFPNVSVMPAQVSRHVDKSSSLLTPDDPLVLSLRDAFFAEAMPRPQFYAEPFESQMQAVDEFIYRKVPWKEDFSVWGVVGLLVTPHEVLTKGAGDCQGQAATTASLLMAMGFRAAVVETPFHWWTHAWDHRTGKQWSLNVHGSAGDLGSVTPQPIDLVVTRNLPRCSPVGSPSCPSTHAYNEDTVLYALPPWTAFANAWTGMHEFRRDIAPAFEGKEILLVLIALLAALGGAVFGVCFHGCACCIADTSFPRALIGMYLWAYVYYPVTLLHVVACLAFMLLVATVAARRVEH